MNEIENNEITISNCIKNRKCDSWCDLSIGCKGWGCRLLVIIPNRVPVSQKEKSSLFSKVYKEAKESGILNCPFFDEINIDRLLDDEKEMHKMIGLNSNLVTELLSEKSSGDV